MSHQKSDTEHCEEQLGIKSAKELVEEERSGSLTSAKSIARSSHPKAFRIRPLVHARKPTRSQVVVKKTVLITIGALVVGTWSMLRNGFSPVTPSTKIDGTGLMFRVLSMTEREDDRKRTWSYREEIRWRHAKMRRDGHRMTVTVTVEEENHHTGTSVFSASHMWTLGSSRRRSAEIGEFG